MTKRRRRKNGWKTLAIVLTVMIVVAVSIFFTKDYLVAKAETKMQDVLIENVLQACINSDSSGASEAATKAKKIYDSMSDTDKKTARALLDDKLTVDNVTKVMSYVKNGNLSGLESYARSVVTESDKKTIKELYYKYRDEIQ